MNIILVSECSLTAVVLLSAVVVSEVSAVGADLTSYELWVLSHNDMPNLTSQWQILEPSE